MHAKLVPQEVQASYVVIIDSILAASDLNTITSKRIREGLQRAVNYDITPQKVALTFLRLASARLMEAIGRNKSTYYDAF